jgi:uncharacterized coiled-coil DUF342 family protein
LNNSKKKFAFKQKIDSKNINNGNNISKKMGNTNSCIEDIKTVNTKIDEVLSLARDCKQKIQEFQNLKEMYQNKVEEIKKNIDQTNISIEKKKTKIE